ncbi:aldehyde dehydrogenase family protein [Paracoccus siganidrum]|uniref:Aldehyde dehydrogenase family protein n=1 Tax=Paracoccus siganidrum TaxID=1276757 RepID=A0A419A715_9RHOB|nr:aldehyde dehydrogenase family protein [Paracoccus siganidrum]RJL14824.1 aldehyde dehydrogenase family protein [Paracoccus siganidrum]RMC30002.1 aldehyde dehydrogenase [Paracoccus siganidrum]
MNDNPAATVAPRHSHYIAGAWTDPTGRSFPDRNPLNGDLVAEIAAGGRPEAEAAVAAAHAAFPDWAAMRPADRQRLFLRAAEITEKRHDEAVHLMAVEAGTSRAFASFQVQLSASLMRQAASWGYLPYGDVLRSDIPGRMAMVTRKPLGVVAGFTPWNGAFYLGWRTILLPMAFGNTVVIKPSEEAPLSAGLLHAEILDEAGFPPGTCNVVTHAPGEVAEIADVFFESRAVRCINFTGSDKTARILAERAGRALKRMVLELGGFNPMIVLEDADLDNAAAAVNFGAFFHQGQICMNTRKVYVARSVHDDFVGRLAARTRTLKSGDPRDPAVVVGPLINARALAQTTERVQDAVDRGARVVAGGRAEGMIYHPTILTDVPKDAICTTGRDETFGPMLVIEPFDDPEQALRDAQDTPYGLSAAIMTGDPARGLDMAQRFDTGIVHVNGATMAGEASLPNGGVKDSGWGRSGHYAVEDFTEIRLTTITQGPGRYPF